jgi:hypothetical protein
VKKNVKCFWKSDFFLVSVKHVVYNINVFKNVLRITWSLNLLILVTITLRFSKINVEFNYFLLFWMHQGPKCHLPLNVTYFLISSSLWPWIDTWNQISSHNNLWSWMRNHPKNDNNNVITILFSYCKIYTYLKILINSVKCITHQLQQLYIDL